MIYNLIAAFIGGVLLAIFIFGFARLIRWKAPGWIYPAAVGVGMIGMNAYLEYTWYPRTVEALPEALVVIDELTYSGGLQPWTLVIPRINAVIVLDQTAVRSNPAMEGVVLVDLFLIARLNPVERSTQLIDCAAGRRAHIDETVEADTDGIPIDPDWQEMGPEDPVRLRVCVTEAEQDPVGD
ncbi:MAG: hypothetical protein AAFX39_12900 [Pseudomonadota bacterium]